ncbi:NADP-dependent oxidoreductase [Pseudonocardia sp. N23]|uniref:NADP-dependent oxidoreductase n=1 Tax=Pseudonocardia sp. N23 TaxID=1987376 RepID=UPI001C0EEF36|nr:NADP-dependent oxidoreductase [Pseudonocardia sp. N23]
MPLSVVLAQRPHGRARDSDFARVEVARRPCPAGGVRARTRHLSIDPAIRGWLDDRPSYLPPVGVGEVVRALGIAVVEESRHPDLAAGDVVRGFTGWQEEVLIEDPARWERLPDASTARLGILGMTGLTAWVGMGDICAPRAGETVFVSAAAGAVGSAAVQLARLAGARVVASAGGPRKCELLTEELGVDAVVDHRADDWAEQLRDATPDGVDALFENVGGPLMEAVLDRMNNRGRIALCGLIAGYNDVVRPPGPRNFGLLVTKRIRAEGFIVADHTDRAARCEAELGAHVDAGRLRAFETVVEGFDSVVPTFVGSFDGGHVGKLVVSLG